MGLGALSFASASRWRLARPAAHFGWLGAILVLAIAVRASHLHHPALFIDEAESAINAMSILEHGYPAEKYLGLPIFENTLVRPWPGGHPEYEFLDVSYSDRGMAIYHGWLPLYAIAGSYWVAGIEPDEPTDPPRVQTTPEEMRRRTVAARVPSVVAGVLLVLIAFVTARVMAGGDWAPAAGLIAATLAALAPPTVRAAREARYYAATHALSLLCCLMLWLMIRRGRWRDFVGGGVVFAILFHTHVLSFAIAITVWALLTPFMLRRPRSLLRIAAFLGILGLAIVPWALAVGFPGQARSLIPAARELLSFPEDYLSYLVRHWKLAIVLVVGVTWVLVISLLGRKLPPRLAGPFLETRSALLLLLGWMALGYVLFLLLVPASSAFLWRLTLPVQGPGIVFIAILLAASARVLGPRVPAPAAVLIGVAMLLVPAVRRPLSPPPQWNQPIYGAIDYLRQQELSPGTRVYASPLHHLTLTLLTGMPVQSTAPIRRDFFTDYEGPLLILETAYRGVDVDAQAVADAARAAGEALSAEQSQQLARELSTLPLREELAARGAFPDPPLEPVPGYLEELVAELRARPPRREDPDGLWDNPAMFRGHEIFDKWNFWQVFFYRFVDPVARSGPNLNYADRIQGARAVVLDSTWVVFHAPPQ